LIVYAIHGVHIHSGSSHTKAIADIAGGVLLLLLGVGLLTGHVRGRRAREPSDEPSRWSISGR